MDAQTKETVCDEKSFYPVIVIGAGFSGIAAGCQLKSKLGCHNFRIFDRYERIGGTWWIHKYPGVACDIPATLYSFSFAQNSRWSTLKPSGKEICDYLENVCETYDLFDNIRLNTEVSHLRWDEKMEEWFVTLVHMAPGAGSLTRSERETKAATCGPNSWIESTDTVRAKVVISAVGKFLEPKIDPNRLPGLQKFNGEVLHTGRWKNNVNLQGKDIVVIGGGCSAAQVVPELIRPAYNVKSITQLVRSPPWIVPNMLSPGGLKLWEKYMPLLLRIPGLRSIVRLILFAVTESTYFLYITPSSSAKIRREKRQGALLAYTKSTIPEKYHKILTPNYQMGCKRVIHDAGWLHSLNNSKVDILDHHLVRIEEDAVFVRAPKQSFTKESEQIRLPADIIILATGYETDSLLLNISVTGRDGTDLHQHWKKLGGPQAYLTLAVDKFPNLFLLNGPNTSSSHTSIIIAIENALLYIIRRISPILRGEVSAWDVRAEVCRRWTSQVQEASKAGVWIEGGCTSWYIDNNAWNGLISPFSTFYSTYRVLIPNWEDYTGWTATYTAEGIRRRRQHLVSAVVFTSLCLLMGLGCSMYVFHRI